MTFHVGQKVVCVNAAFGPGWRKVRRPRRGRIYTVREICTFDYHNGRADGLLLEEIVNPPMNWAIAEELIIWHVEIPFWVERFRPVIERKTDISIFKKMLIGVSKETEPAE